MHTIINSIKSYSNNINIYVVNTIYRANQDAIGRQGAIEGYNPANGQYKYEEDVKVFNMMARTYEELNDESNVNIIPLALMHDSEYNYGEIEIPVNPRNLKTMIIPADSIHPVATGQYQIADVIFSYLCK